MLWVETIEFLLLSPVLFDDYLDPLFDFYDEEYLDDISGLFWNEDSFWGRVPLVL